MEGREVESCILSGMLIACLGIWDLCHRGGAVHGLMAGVGLGIVAATCVAEWVKKKS